MQIFNHTAINNGHIPWSSTTYSNIVSPSLMGGKSRALWCFARNSSIFARSSSSSNAPKLHIRAKMNSFSRWKAGRVPLSSFFGINPSSKLQAFKNQHIFHKIKLQYFFFFISHTYFSFYCSYILPAQFGCTARSPFLVTRLCWCSDTDHQIFCQKESTKIHFPGNFLSAANP